MFLTLGTFQRNAHFATRAYQEIFQRLVNEPSRKFQQRQFFQIDRV
jgi:hypothetical protein